MAITLRNPHSVLATFAARPQDVIDVRLPAGPISDPWSEVQRLARNHRVPVLPAEKFQQRSARRPSRETEGGRAGSAEATIKERRDVSLEDLFGSSADGPSQPGARRGLWLALDQVQDPHNVGAIFRTAGFFGVQGIIVTRDRSSPLNATVYDVASGGMEVVPFAQPPNLSRALEVAKKSGLWILGASEHARHDLADVDRERAWILVVGNEEKGLRRLTREHCDETCRIPARGGVGSLNVSVAVGVLISALVGGRLQ